MKKKIFGGIAVLAITAAIAFNINLDLQNNYPILTLSSVESLAEENGSGSNQKLADVTQNCSNGTSCKCKACILGSTSCTPTCPCCKK